jgi:hypothetical protein
LDLEQMAAGLYYARIYGREGVVVRKIVKE